jgi:hypothetical protein
MKTRLYNLAGIIILLCCSLFLVLQPVPIAEPGPLPEDPAMEDLSRIVYPSMAGIEWEPRFIRPNDSLWSLFGRDWAVVARFNRIDRRHIYPGMTLKVPKNIRAVAAYTPLPAEYKPASRHEKYILISLTEQWLGAYEYGKLKFSMPAASGSEGHNTPTGLFRVDARHRNHTSSLYKTEDEEAQYPMDYAIRFHIDKNDVAYWIHARDLPGRPASHGCVGLYDEAMQQRVYGFPEHPVLLQAEELYGWAVGEEVYEGDSGEFEELEGGPLVEIVGDNPSYHRAPLPLLLSLTK